MPGKALLFGAAVDGLVGVDNDVAAMADALTARGFTVTRLTGKTATRAGILDAYGQLIDDVGQGEPAVVYYSGHGGRTLPPPAADGGIELMDLQFIVPFDFHDGGAEDFRGITSVELSVLLRRLTEKTDNAVAIFDCCHSGGISRTGWWLKSVPRATPYEHLRAHIERLREAGSLDTSVLGPTGNPKAVRLVACAADQAAFEYPGAGGERIGIFTEALTMALHTAADERISWATLLDHVRHRIARVISGQRPEAEGPSQRLLFATEREGHLNSLRAVPLSGDRVSLESAPILGVRPGDSFTVESPSGDRIGSLTVDQVGPLDAQGTVVFAPGVTELPLGARARQATTTAPTLAVAVPAGDPHAAELRRALADAPLLRAVDPADDEPWDAEVRIAPDGALTVADRIGPLHEPRPNGPDGVSESVRDLTKLARAAALRDLASDTRWALNAKVAFEWGLVRDGARHPLPASGAVVRAGEPVFVSVRNQGSMPVYVTLVDIGVSRRIGLLSDDAPSGAQLMPGQRGEYLFGSNGFTGELEGVRLEWPEDLDPAHARPETVLLFVTSSPQDFSSLSQTGIAKSDRLPRTPLEALLKQIATGDRRDLRSMRGSEGNYDVRAVEFRLEPADGFLVEEEPALRPKGAGWQTRTTAPAPAPAGPPPSAVAVRLDELVVHRNRARFGGADIRVDAIVLTGASDSAYPVFRARTERFSHIRAGESLPLDRMLVYHGAAADYLDIALWVSRDGTGALDLGELLTDEVAGFEVQEALARMGGAMTGVPHAAAAAAVLGVGAVVVNVAYRLLRGAVNDVIGLYRGSLLAAEGFGVGRHPAEGVRQVQDFSFAYSVDDVS